MENRKITNYVCEVDSDQAEKLEEILRQRAWKLGSLPHAYWQAKKDKTTICAYKSGKLTVQGKETSEFVTYLLEPEILGKAGLGYENIDTDTGEIISFRPHAGIDESGKGDFFGPLVISAVYLPGKTAAFLQEYGIRDSKRIKSDKKIKKLAEKIKSAVKGKYSTVIVGPEAYNRLYRRIRNLNKLLAWGHARALENLLEKAPECEEVVADKFGDERFIKNALMHKGRKISLEQRVRGEQDIAVAAASIIARDSFVSSMEKLGSQYRIELPKGAGENVEKTAKDLIRIHGPEILDRIAKTHFKTVEKVLSPDS